MLITDIILEKTDFTNRRNPEWNIYQVHVIMNK